MHTPPRPRDKEHLQRALNEARKRSLGEKYGASFGDEDPGVPPETEARWLDCVEHIETQFEQAGTVTIRALIGDPTFHPPDSIPPSTLESEINTILALLYRHQIRVDFLADVSDEDAYRFLTTELMDQEVQDVHMEGLYTCFVYEHFHPNDRYDAVEAVKDFLWHLFSRKIEFIGLHFHDRGMRDAAGVAVSSAQMESTVRSWVTSIALFTTHIIKVTACVVTGDDAVVRVDVRWSGLAAQTFSERSAAGEALFRLRRGPVAGFDIVQMTVPGFC